MKNNIDKIVTELQKHFGNDFAKDDLKLITSEFFDNIGKSLIDNSRIELRGFGSFSLRQRKVPLDPRTNTKNNNERHVCNSVYFRMAKNLIDTLNKK